jgi:hypothetical protein
MKRCVERPRLGPGHERLVRGGMFKSDAWRYAIQLLLRKAGSSISDF